MEEPGTNSTGPIQPPRAPARRFGAWTVSLPLQIGGTASVWMGESALGVAAIKVPRLPAQRAAVLREGELLLRCANPHVVRVVDRADDGSWLALERIEGEAWDRWARNRSADEVLGTALELAGALSAIHGARVVHTDLKPTNILVDAWGHAKIIDLGSAVQTGERATRMTPGFAAPELLHGGRATAAADVYSLGASLYAALCGHLPYDASEPAALLHLATTTAPLPPGTWRAGLPDRAERLILSMLSRDPLERPELSQVIRDLIRAIPLRDAGPGAGTSRPVVGMAPVRSALHREIARAVAGRPVVVVLYGPPGSGRRTLAAQAAKVARREKMTLVDKPDAATFLDALAAESRPCAVLRARKEGAIELAHRVLRGRGAALLVLWDTRPVPELHDVGAVHLSPVPLNRKATESIGAWLGLPRLAVLDAWRQTQGHPAAVWSALNTMIRTGHGGTTARRAIPPAGSEPAELSRDAQRILGALTAQPGPHSVVALARSLKLHPVTLLDECAALDAAGQIVFSPGGDTVKAVGETPQP